MITPMVLLTEDELLQRNTKWPTEVMDGEVVERPVVGTMHGFVGSNIYRALHAHVAEYQLGYTFADGVLHIATREGPGITGALIPDVSFIRRDAMPADVDWMRPFPGVPTLAVEVMSPHDSATQIQRKIRLYFEYGTAQVWVAYPQTQEIHQHIQGESVIRVYQGAEAIDAEAMLPGLQITPEMAFALPDFD